MDEGANSESGPMVGTLILFIITVGFVIGSFFWGRNAFAPLIKTAIAQSWERADGVVSSSYVDVVDRRQYKIRAEYHYRWNDMDYMSEAVFFDHMSGVRKTYYNNIHRELSRHSTANNPIDIWVNPKRPEQAVIYRHIRWDKFLVNLLFFAIWMFITLGLVGASYAAVRDINAAMRPPA